MAECCFAAGLIFAPANLHFAGYSFAAESWVAADAASVAGLSLAVGNSIAVESLSSVHDSLADEVYRAAGPASAVGDLHVADVVLAGGLVVAGFGLDHWKKHYQKPREGTNEIYDPDDCMAVDELLCGDMIAADGLHGCMKRALAALVIYSTCL